MDAKNIETQFRRTHGFVGVFSIDTFPSEMSPFTGAVLNLDVSTGTGTHWVGIFKSVILEYFDPLAQRPPPRLAYRGPILYNKKRIQDEASIACGSFAVDFVKRRLKGEDFTSIQRSYTSNTLFNDLLQ